MVQQQPPEERDREAIVCVKRPQRCERPLCWPGDLGGGNHAAGLGCLQQRDHKEDVDRLAPALRAYAGLTSAGAP
jgi:hypothetical protein